MAAMSGGDQAVGAVPAVPARPDRVQPLQQAGSDLGSPVPHQDVLSNMAPQFAAEVRKRQENLERRLADQQLVDDLAAGNFTGKRYAKFEHEIASYGISVMCGWLHSGYVFQLAAARDFKMHPTDTELEELYRDHDAREELANMTVALALPRFKEQALIGGGWRYDGGASLATYFMGACLYVFPNEFRKRRVYQKKWTRAHYVEAVNLDPVVDPVTDPGVLATGNMRVREDLERTDARAQAIVALTLDDYSQEEIAELLGEPSIRAVEGVLYRWRTKEQARIRKGGGHDERK